jgi:gamma-glutamyltranspeptidase/glutathione hydrolase
MAGPTRTWLRRLGALVLGATLTLVAALPAPLLAAAPGPVRAPDGMVVTSQRDATEAGHKMLRVGGNAVDAAVASAFALAVAQPFSAGLGGGAFLLIRKPDGEVVALDARETAPAAATVDMYTQPGVDEYASLRGSLSVATPGFVAGLALALERYGTLSLAQVLEPAVELAERGFEIGPYHVRMLGFMQKRGMDEAFPETGRIQFPQKGQPIELGWRLVQRDLGRTLRSIAWEGTTGFYHGAIAEAIADDMAKSGGLVTREDLAGYEPKVRPALQGTYRGYDVYSFPPPSSGGVAIIESLNILEGFDLASLGAGSSASLHRIAEALKLAFADRNTFLGDSDFVDIPVAGLIDKSRGTLLRGYINPPRWRRAPWTWGRSESAIEVAVPGQPQNDAGTTHLSTTDGQGGAVALTMTINTPFGSGMTVPGTGIILNNEMDDFSVAPGTPNTYGLIDVKGANSIAPGKRPLSSMSPTFLVKDGKLFMVTGSPGGPRIISTTLQAILNVVDYGMSVSAAVAAPRIHHQWLPNRISVEPDVPADVVEGLRARGHEVKDRGRRWSAAESIVIDPETGWHLGGNDPRRDGLAKGFDHSREAEEPAPSSLSRPAEAESPPIDG